MARDVQIIFTADRFLPEQECNDLKHLLKSDYRKKELAVCLPLSSSAVPQFSFQAVQAARWRSRTLLPTGRGIWGVSGGSAASLGPRYLASALCVVDGETKDAGTELTAEAGALFNITDGTVLYSKNVFEELYPASITKVMTAILAIEEGELFR